MAAFDQERCSAHDARLHRWRKSGTRRAALWLCGLLCAGGSPSPAVATPAPYDVIPVADGLRHPRSIAQLPDGRLLVAERAGRLLLLDGDGGRRQLSGTPVPLLAGDGGFLDVAVDLDFRRNRTVYLSYATGSVEASTVAVFRARLRDGNLHDGGTWLRVRGARETPRHFGGRLLQLPDRSLLVTVGDGLEWRENAQSLRSESGKVLRVNRMGLSPGDNPFRQRHALRIWTLGHRNPLGLAFDARSRAVFLHEQGPRGGDELNLLQRGHNYGWPAVTHGRDFSGARVSPYRYAQGYDAPLWVWPPALGPTGMAWYGGDEFPRWRDCLLVVGPGARGVHRLRVHRARVVEEEWLLTDLPYPLRDVRVFRHGGIHLLTNGEAGRILRIEPATPR